MGQVLKLASVHDRVGRLTTRKREVDTASRASRRGRATSFEVMLRWRANFSLMPKGQVLTCVASAIQPSIKAMDGNRAYTTKVGEEDADVGDGSGGAAASGSSQAGQHGTSPRAEVREEARGLAGIAKRGSRARHRRGCAAADQRRDCQDPTRANGRNWC